MTEARAKSSMITLLVHVFYGLDAHIIKWHFCKCQQQTHPKHDLSLLHSTVHVLQMYWHLRDYLICNMWTSIALHFHSCTYVKNKCCLLFLSSFSPFFCLITCHCIVEYKLLIWSDLVHCPPHFLSSLDIISPLYPPHQLVITGWWKFLWYTEIHCITVLQCWCWCWCSSDCLT